MRKKTYNLVLVFFIATLLNSCSSTGPTLYTSAQNTPISHPENKVLFVNLLTKDNKPSTDDVVILRFGHELQYAEKSERLGGWLSSLLKNLDENTSDDGKSSKFKKIPKENLIQKDDPFSIILNSVWVPSDPSKGIFSRLYDYFTGSGGKDIAVILDIITQDGKSKPLVVAYQRDVRGGHLLNFKNIVVYNTKNWDGIHQPYFHLRIMDVTAERNTNTQEMLDSAATSVNSLSGIVPSAYIPHISQAIKTSKYILGRKENKIILDYKIQFFNLSASSDSRVTKSVNQVLDRFAQGNWMAIGRPADADANFWDADFSFNRKSSLILRKGKSTSVKSVARENDYGNMNLPYVSMVVVKKDFGISKSIIKSFNSFASLVLNGETKVSPKRVFEIAEELKVYGKELEGENLLIEAEAAIKNMDIVEEEKLKYVAVVVNKFLQSNIKTERNRLSKLISEQYGVHIGHLYKDMKQVNIKNIEEILKISSKNKIDKIKEEAKKEFKARELQEFKDTIREKYGSKIRESVRSEIRKEEVKVLSEEQVKLEQMGSEVQSESE